MLPRVEEGLNVKNLPFSKPDYTIYTRRKDVLGCIEAKAYDTLQKQSVIQAMLQLVSLQEKAEHTLFSIVTNGYQFFFICLQMDGTFKLETYQLTRKKQKLCKIYTLSSHKDLPEIVAKVYWLIKRGLEKVAGGIQEAALRNCHQGCADSSDHRWYLSLVIGKRNNSVIFSSLVCARHLCDLSVFLSKSKIW